MIILFLLMVQWVYILHGEDHKPKTEKQELLEYFKLDQGSLPDAYAIHFLDTLSKEKNLQERDTIKEKCKKLLSLVTPSWTDNYCYNYDGKDHTCNYKERFMDIFLQQSWNDKINDIPLTDFLPSLVSRNDNRGIPSLLVAKNPHVINELLYIYGVDVYWSEQTQLTGFMLNGDFYDDYSGKNGYLKRTPAVTSNYIKAMLKPRCSPLHARDIYAQRKAVLLCLRRKNLKVPSVLLRNCIFPLMLPDEPFRNILYRAQEYAKNQFQKSDEKDGGILSGAFVSWHEQELINMKVPCPNSGTMEK